MRSRKYLNSYANTDCEACGINDGTVVGCHFNFENFARGMKAPDALTAGLCHGCHALADGRTNDTKQERDKIWLRVLKNRLPDRYERFMEEMANV